MSSVEVAQRFFEEFPAYSEYKDSGIDWLGEIPKHWRVSPLKRVAQIIDGDRGSEYPNEKDYVDFGIPFLSSKNIVDSQLSFDDLKFISKNKFDRLGSGKLKPKDIVITVRGSIGNIAVFDDDRFTTGFINAQMMILRLLKEMNTKFAYMYFRSIFWKNQLDFTSYGTAQQQLSNVALSGFYVSIPPIEEQKQIATFLDRATTEIDQIIEQQKQLITLLEEERTTVISHAVTKGLDPSVPMKDSGIEWLGEIPKHWELKRLGWITKEINDINHEMPVAVEKGIPFLSAKDLVDNGQLNFTDDVKMISEQDFERLSKKIFPIKEDIIYSRIGARLGKARLVKTDIKFQVSYSCCVIRVKHEFALPEYICFILDSEIVLTEAKLKTVGIGVPDLGLDTIGRFLIPLPTLEEQQGILDYLYQETARIDEAIDNVRSQIEKLEEYRTVLISDAVTGKIDVRGFNKE